MPVRFTSSTPRQTSSVSSSIGTSGCDRPALLNSRSTRPNVSRACSNSATTDASSLTSVGTGRSGPPMPWPCRAVCSSPAAPLPASTTDQPSPARASAAARPMPLPAPVTIATRARVSDTVSSLVASDASRCRVTLSDDDGTGDASAAATTCSRPPVMLLAGWHDHLMANANAGQLACFAEDDDRVSDRHGRLGPGAMVGAFELVAAHLAFHRTRVGTQPPLGDPLSNDLGDRPPDRPGDLVRGKTPRGWPGDDARSATCPQTTAGRGPSPRPGRPGASACGSRSGPAGAPRPPAPHPRDAWSAAPPARRAGGSSTHPARPRPPSAGGTARPTPPRVPGRGQGSW